MAEDDDVTPSPDSPSTKDERRRPGRVNYRNPHLIRLLRGELPIKPPEEEEPFNDDEGDKDTDDLRIFKGLLNSIWISLIIWGIIFFLFM